MPQSGQNRNSRIRHRTAAAGLVVQSLNKLAHQHGLILEQVNWFTHPSEDAPTGTYTLLVSSKEKLEELVFLRQELECLPHSAYARKRIERLLAWVVGELAT
jgi:hypothetical protein